MRRRLQRGFTLLEILIVVAIVGILAAAAIYNYMSALTRARQKRTMADMRTIATAWEARASDGRSYGNAGFTFPTVPVTYQTLSGLLLPTYARTLPNLDGWSRPLEFSVNDDGTLYGIRSPGRDGTFETTYTDGTTDDPDCDIVYSSGSFVVYPATVQND